MAAGGKRPRRASFNTAFSLSFVEGALFCDMALRPRSRRDRKEESRKSGPHFPEMSPKDVSSFLGLRRSNLAKLKERCGGNRLRHR